MKLANIVDLAAKALALMFAIGLLFGGIVALRYCLHISYYPAGVSVADSLFLISASLMFLVIYGFYLGLSFGLAGLLLLTIRRPYNWLVDLVRRRFGGNPPRIDKIDPSVKALAPAGLLAAPLLALLYSRELPLASAASLTVLVHGFLLLLLSSGTLESPEPLMDATVVAGDPKSKRKVAVKWVMIGFMIVSPLVLSGAFIFLSQMTMQVIGIYIKEVDIGLSGNSAAFVRQTMSVTDAVPDAKAKPETDALVILKGAEVLWAGVGSHTAVRLRGVVEGGFFVLPNEEVLVPCNVHNFG